MAERAPAEEQGCGSGRHRSEFAAELARALVRDGAAVAGTAGSAGSAGPTSLAEPGGDAAGPPRRAAPEQFGKFNPALPSPYAQWELAVAAPAAVAVAAALPGALSWLGAFATWKASEVVGEGAEDVKMLLHTTAKEAEGMIVSTARGAEETVEALTGAVADGAMAAGDLFRHACWLAKLCLWVLAVGAIAKYLPALSVLRLSHIHI